LQWTALEARRPVLAGEGAKETLFYPGGGFTSKLHNLCNANQIPFVTLLIFCSEGDNIPGVLLVANHLDRWMKLIPTTNNAPAWKFPISWKHFFGNPPPISMY
jgi:proteasome assembly chaperone 2